MAALIHVAITVAVAQGELVLTSLFLIPSGLVAEQQLSSATPNVFLNAEKCDKWEVSQRKRCKAANADLHQKCELI